MAINYNDIYYNKKDGYWIVVDEKDEYEKTITLYKKKINTGIIYNSYDVKLIFTLTVVECNKFIPNPKLFNELKAINFQGLRKIQNENKTSNYSSNAFMEELKKRVQTRNKINFIV